MPIIARKGFCFTDPLAGLCIIAALCAASIAGAEPQTAQPEDAPAVKKKIALAQFDVANTQHVDDISNIYDGLPLSLSSRLEASGEFLTAYTGRSIPVEAGEAQRNTIVQVAEETGAQLLISGMVVNSGLSQPREYSETQSGRVRKRHIEVEFSVYDGLTGDRLLLRRIDEQARGDVMVGNDKPFGSSIFFETELGQAINRLLDRAVADIRAALKKVPFTAHIVRVEEAKVFLDAGSDSLLKPGDKLVAYARGADPVVGLKGSVLGVTDRATDTVTLTRVQPRFSIGELTESAENRGIKANDIVRINPDEQRALMAKQIAAQQMAKAEQEAKIEAARVKAEQDAQAEASRAKAEQDARAETERIKAEKKAQAQAAADAKAAKLKAAQKTKTTRISAAQKARDRAEKARAAADAKAAQLKAQQEADAQATRGKAKKPPVDVKNKAAAKTLAPQAAVSGAAQTKTGAETTAETEKATVKKKPGIPLKLTPIKP